jgi:hypothetical protein
MKITKLDVKRELRVYWIDSVKNLILPANFGVDPNTKFPSMFSGLKHLNRRSLHMEGAAVFSSLVGGASRTSNSN